MAASRGHYELCDALIEAGADAQASICRSPLNGLLEWQQELSARERMSKTSTTPGEKKLVATLLNNAQKTYNLLTSKGATDWKMNPLQFHQAYMSGQVRLPSISASFLIARVLTFANCLEATSELLSSIFTPYGQPGGAATGQRTFLPSREQDFIVQRGKRNSIQNLFTNIGRQVESIISPGSSTRVINQQWRPQPRYAPHSCWPWVPCKYHSEPPPGGVVDTTVRDNLKALRSAPLERIISAPGSANTSCILARQERLSAIPS